MIRRTCIVAFAFFVAFAARAVTAQPLAERVPADALIYVGWTGVDRMGPGYDGSHLKAMLDAAEMPRVMSEVIPKLLERLVQEDPDAAEAARMMSEVLRPMWRRPTALYVGPIDMTNPRQPVPSLALLCEAGEDAPAMERTLEEALRRADDLPFKTGVRTVGGIVALTVGRTTEIDAMLAEGADKAKSLAQAKPFAAAMSMQKSPVVAAYVDAEAILRLIDETVAKGNDADAKEKWPKARDALGLGGLKRIAFAQGFDGKDWTTHAFVEAPEPRTGLLAGLEAEPVSDAAIKSIPSSATMAGVARLDLSGIFDGLRDAVGKLDPHAAQEMDDGIRQVNEMLGLDIRKDVLDSLGDEWAYYVAPEVTGRGPLGVVIVNRLKDEASAQKASDRLKKLANAAIERENKDPDVHIRFKEAKVDDVTVHYLATPVFTPSWVIRDGNLYLGAYPQIAAAAASQASREGKSILDNPDFVALRKRLGGERATSFQFYDLPKSAPTSYQVWLFFSSFGKFGDIIGVDTPAALLPPLGKLLEHLSPAGSVSWVDEQGWHFHAVSPFPGSTLLASETAGLMSVQSSAVMASILLPSLNRAREQARRVQSMTNLRNIGQSTFIYANEFRGKFPDDLGELVVKTQLPPTILVNPRTDTSVPAGLEGEALKAWANESSDYIYLGKGKKSSAGADVVLAYENPRELDDGLNILFCDGHVEFLRMPEALEMIERAGLDGAAGKPGNR